MTFLQRIGGAEVKISDSDKNNEPGSNPSKGIFVLVLFLIRAIMCTVFLFLMETTRKRKSDLQ